MTTIAEECRQVALLLAAQGRKLVLAESCTCGMVAAKLGQVPGVSSHFCGSLVSYRDESKTAWLKIPSLTLLEHHAVSDKIARMMVEAALAVTPESDFAASVTGHFGPDAPHGLDGVIFVGLARRKPDATYTDVSQFHLTAKTRVGRQREATRLVLTAIRQVLLGVW